MALVLRHGHSFVIRSRHTLFTQALILALAVRAVFLIGFEPDARAASPAHVANAVERAHGAVLCRED